MAQVYHCNRWYFLIDCESCEWMSAWILLHSYIASQFHWPIGKNQTNKQANWLYSFTSIAWFGSQLETCVYTMVSLTMLATCHDLKHCKLHELFIVEFKYKKLVYGLLNWWERIWEKRWGKWTDVDEEAQERKR